MSKVVIENEILEYLSNKEDKRSSIKYEFEKFTKAIIPELKVVIENKKNAKAQNIYQLCGATKLSVANDVTRTYSTKLGLLWERIAALSSNVISPELELGFKIPEVDVIVKYEGKLYYTQLKTQKNTLTGSQFPRTKMELEKYENSWFVACIKTSCSWTYSKKSNRLLAEQFWNKIDIDYEKDILPNLKASILEIEKLMMDIE